MINTFRSLAGRDFRLYFSGQCVSLVGTWVQQVALSWIAYRVTGSAFMLGLIAFAGQFPTLVLSPFGGMLADRYSKRGLLVAIQLIQMAVASALAILAWHGGISPAVLIAASVVLGVTSAVEMPVRQAFTPDIVHDRTLMANAIALNSVTFNAARLVGPAIAGAILAAFSEAACFAVNALSYVPTVYTLFAIHPTQARQRGGRKSLREAAAYLRQFAPARWLLLTVTVTSFCLSPYLTFMPVYAKDIFNGGPDTLGALMAASGFGALGAGLYLANRKSIVGLGDRMVTACIAAGIASAAFAYNPLLAAALPLLVISGCATIIIVTSSNMFLQSLVPDDLRGRVMALYTMCFIGVLPIGSLAAGGIAHVVGVQPVFLASGAVFAVIGFSLKRKLPYLREKAHPVLREKGLLPK